MNLWFLVQIILHHFIIGEEEKLEKKKELLTECATELEKLPEDVVGDILLVIKGAALVCQSNKKAS